MDEAPASLPDDSPTVSLSGAKSEEKGGGREEEDASEAGYCGGGDCSVSFSVAAAVISSWLRRGLFCSCSQCTTGSTTSALEDTKGLVAASCDADNAAD